jgi:uncharacterized protein YndB with AHSA1/START domain
MTGTEQTDATIVRITRTFPAPREVIFRAWTEPDLFVRWWWPANFATVATFDLRPGGRYEIRTADIPERGVLAISGSFLEVTPPARLVYTWRWDGLDPTETRVTVEFHAHGDHTTIALTHERFPDRTEAENHRLGWESCLDRLDTALAAGTLLTGVSR